MSRATASTSPGKPGGGGAKSAGTSRSTLKGTFIDPQALMRIRSLQLRARIVVQGFLSGLHRSPHHGFSVEFSEYRQYSPGDDPRWLDWKLYARSDRYYIKRFQEETNLSCHILVDLSRSMAFGGDGTGAAGYSKVEYARTAAATLAYFLAGQRDAVGLTTFDETTRDILPARYRPGHLRRIMVCLERAVAGKSTNVAPALELVASTVRRRGLIVLISDLMAPPQDLRPRLAFLRSRGHEVVVLRLLDPAEIDFSYQKPSMFVDLETGQEHYIDPHFAREEYLTRFKAHAQQVERDCRELGIDIFQISTARPLELVLFDFLQARVHLGRASHRPGHHAAATSGGVV